MTIVRRMIDRPQLAYDVVVEEVEDRVRDVDQRLEDVGDGRITPGAPGLAALNRRARLDRVVAAVAERVAAHHAPGGEDRAADDPSSRIAWTA